MSQCTITITDPDTEIEYTLAVGFTGHEAVPSIHTSYGWDPPEPAFVEIDGDVRCTKIVTHCGERAYAAFPGQDKIEGGEKQAGEWAWSNFKEQIREKVEAHAGDDGPDPDEMRDRQIDRDCEERAERRRAG